MRIRNLIYFLAGLAILFSTSCTELNDNIQSYLDRGEINYLGRPDSAYTLAGKQRVIINWLVKNDPRIESYTIFWNDLDNKKQEVSGSIDRNLLTDGYMSNTLDVEEGSYLFSIVHTGSKGYNSIATEVMGNAYGDIYASTLLPREIASVAAYADHIEINWSQAEESVVDLELTYEANDGSERTVRVSATEMQTNIYEYKQRGKYFWVTWFQPESTIDKFSVTSIEYEFPIVKYTLNKSGWTASAPTSHWWGTGPGAVIDDNNNSYWHSAVDESASSPNRPYYIEVDMKNIKNVLSVTVEKRYDPKEIEIRSSINGTEWTMLGRVIFDGGERDTKTLELNDEIQAQFLRFYITDSTSGDGRGGIFEINVLGWD
ncbi:MAG: discoidin domain-containing protein [Tannerellaceae bacterium]|jgi:hypothetical protein|nr:discoidin domain-containing protein [Tannerellaceae bacterium]